MTEVGEYVERFNSMIVRLKAPSTGLYPRTLKCFNSMIVRLKDLLIVFLSGKFSVSIL